MQGSGCYPCLKPPLDSRRLAGIARILPVDVPPAVGDEFDAEICLRTRLHRRLLNNKGGLRIGWRRLSLLGSLWCVGAGGGQGKEVNADGKHWAHPSGLVGIIFKDSELRCSPRRQWVPVLLITGVMGDPPPNDARRFEVKFGVKNEKTHPSCLSQNPAEAVYSRLAGRLVALPSPPVLEFIGHRTAVRDTVRPPSEPKIPLFL